MEAVNPMGRWDLRVGIGGIGSVLACIYESEKHYKKQIICIL